MNQERVMLYEGKAKQIFKTDDEAKVIIPIKMMQQHSMG